MNLFISTFSLSHSKCVEYELFVSSSKTNFNNILHYLQNILPYIIIKYKMHYVSFKKKLTKFKTCNLENNIYIYIFIV